MATTTLNKWQKPHLNNDKNHIKKLQKQHKQNDKNHITNAKTTLKK